MKNSKLGLASLLIGIAAYFIGRTGLNRAFYLQSLTQIPNMNVVTTESYTFSMVISISFAVVLALIGIILGIFAWFRPNRKKVLSIFGVITNGMVLVAFIVLMSR